MTDINFWSDSGFIPYNNTSINQQFHRLYGNEQYRPTKISLLQRDISNINKTENALDRLPISIAPTGVIYDRYARPENIPIPNRGTYRSTLKNGLSLPVSKEQPLHFLNQLTPDQIRLQQEQANSKVVRDEYSRSVPQRTSTFDRGLD